MLVFIELNILIFILLWRQKRTHQNPGPALAIQPAPSPQPPPPSRRRRKRQNSWVMPWILQRQEKGCHRNLLPDFIQTNSSGYQNFVRMPTAVFDLIQDCIHYCIKKEVINFRLFKLAITLRHLDNRRNLHVLTVSLASWLNHHM